ncbi:MAG TPA: hypothetical protein VED59_07565 [Acidimicrobiales bacterium]|nr:hypothetical protein [Acidimicrobiales bacterium]
MLDHLFLDTIGALRAALDESLLQRAGQEDRLTSDLLLGDLAWETSMTLPGEEDPPRVCADISLDWPTWSQSAWRSLSMGELVEDPPEIGVEVVFRVQRLASKPDLRRVLSDLPEASPDVGGEGLSRSAPVVEEAYKDDNSRPEIAVEVAYEGSFRLPSSTELETEEAGDQGGERQAWSVAPLVADDPAGSLAAATRQTRAVIEATLSAVGAWVASTLVRLADLQLDYLPPEQAEDS